MRLEPPFLDDPVEAEAGGPAVSVIVPTYQRRELVRPAVASVLTQTYRDFELIVIDDGSTDGTGEALAGLDERLRYQWQSNRGVAAARNAGLRLARGSIVAFLDSDNRWLPDHLTVVTEMLARHPEAVLASTCRKLVVGGKDRASDARLVDCRGQITQAALIGWFNCLAVRREALMAIGGFDERLPAREDADLVFRLATLGPFITVRRRTIVRQATAGSFSDRARRAGDYLTAAELSASNVAAAARRLREPDRSRLAAQARGLAHFARAITALDRGDESTSSAELVRACRHLPLSEMPEVVEHRVRCHLTRAHERPERLRALTALAELWPDRRADTARFMRAIAIATAVRSGRPRQAAKLLTGWPRGGSFRFARRVSPSVQRLARRSLQERRYRRREVVELPERKLVAGDLGAPDGGLDSAP